MVRTLAWTRVFFLLHSVFCSFAFPFPEEEDGDDDGITRGFCRLSLSCSAFRPAPLATHPQNLKSTVREWTGEPHCMCLSFRIRKAKACFCSSSSSVHVFGGKKLACIVSRIVRLRRSSFAFFILVSGSSLQQPWLDTLWLATWRPQFPFGFWDCSKRPQLRVVVEQSEQWCLHYSDRRWEWHWWLQHL